MLRGASFLQLLLHVVVPTSRGGGGLPDPGYDGAYARDHCACAMCKTTGLCGRRRPCGWDGLGLALAGPLPDLAGATTLFQFQVSSFESWC